MWRVTSHLYLWSYRNRWRWSILNFKFFYIFLINYYDFRCFTNTTINLVIIQLLGRTFLLNFFMSFDLRILLRFQNRIISISPTWGNLICSALKLFWNAPTHFCFYPGFYSFLFFQIVNLFKKYIPNRKKLFLLFIERCLFFLLKASNLILLLF